MNGNSKRALIALLTLACWIVSSGLALAVDGVIEIDPARTLVGGVTPGDAPGYPVEINESGSYRLTSDLHVPSDKTGILIDADDVTLDLNGFSVFSSGEVGANVGVSVFAGTVNVEIRNGTVRNFFGFGITTGTFTELRLIDLRILNNLSAGANLEGAGNHVERCTISGNGAQGLSFFFGAGSLVIDSVVYDNTTHGIVLDAAAWRSNVLTENNGGNANPQSVGGTEIGPNLCGTDLVCP